MFRRDFFKMLVGAAASVVCAPLAKLLPRKPVNLYVEAAPRLTVNRLPLCIWEIMRKADEDMKVVTGIYDPAFNDLDKVYTRAFAEGRIRIVEPDGTVKLLRA